MTPVEFKEARLSLGLNRPQLAEILGTSPDTIRKWEMPDDRSNARSPNPVASQVMRWMLDGFRPPEFPS
jgi:DNA-binding transcriptional regulator YiaG